MAVGAKFLTLLFIILPNVLHARSVQTPQKPVYANLEKVIADLENVTKMANDASSWARISLARVNAMSYVTGDSQVPLGGGENSNPDIYQWIRDYTQTPGTTDLPLKVKPPVTPERLARLARACTIFADLEKKYGSGLPEQAWCLIQQGRKKEAKAILAKLYSTEIERDERSSSDAPHNVIELLLPAGAHEVSIALSGKPSLQQPVFSYKLHQFTQNVRLSEANARRPANWAGLGDAYLKAPSSENFQALISQIRKDVPSDSTQIEIQIGSFGHTYVRSALEEILNKLHAQNIRGAAFLQENFKTAMHTENAAKCAKLAGSAAFAEGNFSLALVCATRLAWKEKNWGHCRDLLSAKSLDMESFPLCLNYLAFRSGKEILCEEVESFLKNIKETNAGYFVQQCREAAHGKVLRGIQQVDRQPGADFYGKADWPNKTFQTNWGEASLAIRSGTSGRISLEDVIIRETSIHYSGTGRQRNRYASFSLYEESALRKDLATVTILGMNGAKLSSVDEKITLLKSDDSYGTPPPDFTLEKAIGDRGGFISYYLAVLDPKEDAETLEKMRKLFWAARERAKSQKKLEMIED